MSESLRRGFALVRASTHRRQVTGRWVAGAVLALMAALFVFAVLLLMTPAASESAPVGSDSVRALPDRD